MELSKNYTPGAVEDKWLAHWKKQEYFNSKPDHRSPFTVVIPPPNVTGVLHMGHTLNETVQDILVRRARMQGFNACWVPGSDHASIATEARVVHMLEEKGIRKHDITREAFLRHAFEWKEKYGDIIYHQFDKLGCSVDWNRVTFTMDDHYYKAVIKVFVDLYEKGLIYRGARMINWDPEARTALSEEEVEYRDVQGKLYHIRYRIAENPDEEIVIATQRPETIMGDTGVGVHPDDERYRHLVGKHAIVPLIDKKIPIVADAYIDPAFGTGVLKITPAHDINDYQIGLRHQLEVVDVLNEDGTLSEAAQIYVGTERFTARKKIVQELQEKGRLLKEETYATRLGYSQRTSAVVEPKISTQWFVSMKHLADLALDAVLQGEVKIHPEERFLNTYKNWLGNIRDWCISRQLWWGQRIPAWYDRDGNCFVAADEGTAIEKALIHYRKLAENVDEGGRNKALLLLEAYEQNPAGFLWQDEDVLDTWFSSWLWPMEVFKGISQPDNPDINYYYPTSVLVTGQDIIFFWVARMIMAGIEYRKEAPFSDVYFTGMVRDKQGRKMSKSLGNSPDLLQLIERYGADAVRFGIMISAPAGNDLLFDESSPEQGRNFNNKIWNALKLVKGWSGRLRASEKEAEDFPVLWFRDRLNEAKSILQKNFSEFKLSENLKILYSLIWENFCSWYLEWIKPPMDQPIDERVYTATIDFFEELMALLHPFMPFVTEEIYHQLRNRPESEALCVRQLGEPAEFDRIRLKEGELLKEVISTLRDTRVKNQIKPRDLIKLQILSSQQELYQPILHLLQRQVNAESIAFTTEPVSGSITIVVQQDRFYLIADREVDQEAQKEQLQKDLLYYRGFLETVEKKLGNERFVQNAKPDVVEAERKKKADAEARIRAIWESLAHLGYAVDN